MTKRFQLPTPEEVRAIELAARRAQMEELHRLVSAAARGTKAFILRTVNALRAKLRRHAGGGVAKHGA
ncbi:MAG TPA: hypothetical protein VD839_14165 [Burkholderiales bacterium]|jgi:hypothetical protein|nr:hypothetical protein [Burkholderiales bacterium]